MRTILYHIILFKLFIACSASALPEEVFFRPSVTDPTITESNQRHYAVVDSAVASRDRLVLFLPGTRGTPFGYRQFPKNAATLGFHSLGLMYPNENAINLLCREFAPLDPDAAGNARLEVIDGVDRVNFLTVDSINSIQNRVIKALQYLHETYPLHGWDQYFIGDGVLWNKVIVCGHSQGAGMAAMLAKTRITDRCIMFAGTDWWEGGTPPRPYNWMFTSPQTPVDRWYLFAHERDQIIDFSYIQDASMALDLSRYGAHERVESSSNGYKFRHFLSTNLEPNPESPNNYHGCPVVDVALPMESDGVTPVFKTVWDSTSINIIFSPGTLEHSEDLINWTPQLLVNSPLVLPLDTLPHRSFYRLRTP